MDELVVYLRELRDGARLSVGELHVLLVATVKATDPLGRPPAASTLHKLLRGENLHNAARTVETIVDICANAAGVDVGPAQKRARELRESAYSQLKMLADAATRPPSTPGELDRDRELAQIRGQLAKALQENARLAAEATAANKLLAAVSSAEPTESAVSGLMGRVQELAEATAAAGADAYAARTEIAQLRNMLVGVTQTPAPRQSSNEKAPADSDAGAGADAGDDAELARLAAALLRLDPDGSRAAGAAADAGAYLLDGERTGRFAWDELSKTEKSMLAPTVSRLMQSTFSFGDGRDALFALDGIDFDVYFSRVRGKWMFPPDQLGRLAVVVDADDHVGKYGFGIVRVSSEVLSASANQDGKRALSAQGRETVLWLHESIPFDASVLLRLSPMERAEILEDQHASKRLSELFRRIQDTAIPRSDIAAVCRQSNYLKRVRDVRRILAAEGIAVLSTGTRDGSDVLTALGKPPARPGSFLSTRLVPTEKPGDAPPTVEAGGASWRRAESSDPVTPLPRNLYGDTPE